MLQTLRDGLPWLLSCITILQAVLSGNKHRHAWLLGLGNQVLWLAWICIAGTWGLLPMNAALTIIFWRNHRLWRRDAAAR